MHKITLVCSAHGKNGLCNAEELLKILLAIEPEVVFLEIRPSDDSGLVEAQAISRYREFKSCQPVHVDRHDMPPANSLAEIKQDVDRVFDYVAQRSEEYELLEFENASGANQPY